MIRSRWLFAFVCVFAAGCRSTLTVPPDAVDPAAPSGRMQTPAPGPSAATSAPVLRGAIGTASGLQSAYNAVARAEPNVPDGVHPNRSALVQIGGEVVIDKPLRVPGNAVTVAAPGVTRAAITYYGTDVPILLVSAVGNGATVGVRFDGVNIYAPNARALYDWDPATHTGNAHVFTIENAAVTCNNLHFNLNAPGDGRAYYFTFRNIDVYGTGQIARNDAKHGAPIVMFDGIRCTNRRLNGPAFDLYNVGGMICNSWLELSGTQLVRMRGNFGFLRWLNNYNEPHESVPDNEQVVVDGTGNVFEILDALYFIMPSQHVAARNGGRITFTGYPDCTDAGGGHPDWTKPLGTYAALIRQCFTAADSRSIVAWPAGRVDSRGVFEGTAETPVSEPAATSK